MGPPTTSPERESRASEQHGRLSCWQRKWRKTKKQFKPGFVPIQKIRRSAPRGVIDIERTNARFGTILLKKSFLAHERNFSAPLVRFTRSDVGTTSIHAEAPRDARS